MASDGRVTTDRVRIWLATKILPPGWGPCLIGRPTTRTEGYVDIYGNWHDSRVRQ